MSYLSLARGRYEEQPVNAGANGGRRRPRRMRRASVCLVFSGI